MTAAPNPGVLFTDCQRCDGTGCLRCRAVCRICELIHDFPGPETIANTGTVWNGRYCDKHDPSTAEIPY